MRRARATTGSTGDKGRRAGQVGQAALDAKWDALAAEAFLGIKEWRLQHPKATFAEIEVAVDERLSAVRARMLEDVALASAAATVSDTPLVARPACPVCAGGTVGGSSDAALGRDAGMGRLEARGQHSREVTVTYGRTVTLTREYTVCSVCGTGLFPPG
jgi:hypothetical protein